MDTRVIPDPDEPGAWMVEIDGVRHSWVDPADPTRLEFSYMRTIADLIDAHADAAQRLRVIHAGGAAMTLARYVAHKRPTSAQIVLEPDVELTAEVRAKVPLPRGSGIKVRDVDARRGIAAMRPGFADIIIVDAFADSCVPADLVTVEFFSLVREALRGDGVVAMNVTDGHTLEWVKRVIAGLASCFSHVAASAETGLFKGHRFGNLVLAGSDAPLPSHELARRAASAVFPQRWLEGQALTRFTAGARPFYDAASLPSPRADGLFIRG